MDHDADLVVVGCGPVGVMAALRATQRGMRVIAIDAEREIYPLPRAIGMDEEIQRLFQNAGLLDLVRSVSTPLLGAEFVDADGTRIIGMDTPPGTIGDSGHPPMAMFEQPLLEAGLRRAAVDAGVDMRLGVRATALSQDSAVQLECEDDRGAASTLTARWLLGADGASSTIRPLIGVGLDDLGFDQEWLVVDTTVLDESCDLPRLARQVCDPVRVITYVPGHETRRRWEIQFRAGETREHMLEEATILGLIEPWVRPEQIRIDRTAVYRFHALVADRLRVGNVFLAGDAAHQMPPFNGQGMNTGLRDAENLTWKLALVAGGRCGEGLLDSYEQERLPHAAGQVAHSADAGRLIDALAAGQDFDTAAGYGGGRPFPHLEDGVRVGDHSALGKPFPQPVVDGVLFDECLGDGFALVSTGPVMASADTLAWWDRLGAWRVAVEHPRLARLAPPGTTVVVRPDRYVAALTDDLDATTRALAALLHTPAP